MGGEVEDGIHAILNEVAMDYPGICHQAIGSIRSACEDDRWSFLGTQLYLHHV